jgi:hypothetical protein
MDPELVSQSEIVLFLFMGADPNIRKSFATATITYSHVNAFLNEALLGAMLSGDTANGAAKSVFLAWLEQERQPILVRRALAMASDANLKEAAPIALRIAADKGALVTTRAYALTGSAKLFEPEHFKQLEELMQDQLVMRRTQRNGDLLTTEMRDIALGVAIQASGQKPNDFGFERFIEYRPTSSNAIQRTTSSKLINLTGYSLTDKQRAEAFKKWKEWRENQATK